MADEPVLNDAWEVLKGNLRCALCNGLGVGEVLERGDEGVYEVVEGACQACDGTGWTSVDQFRSKYWGEYMLLVALYSAGDPSISTVYREIVDRQIDRWQKAMRSLRGRH